MFTQTRDDRSILHPPEISRVNNFDLLRIVAALQVVYGHALDRLDIVSTELWWIDRNITAHFPGVPIFFVVSGFLISWSFDRNRDALSRFYWNRGLRIFPALWTCVAVTVMLLVWQTQLGIIDFVTRLELVAWLLGQVTVLQSFTPEILRGWATGVPNGALWTIAVEIEFYLVVPMLLAIPHLRVLGRRGTHALALIALASVVINALVFRIEDGTGVRKLAEILVPTYLYYFLFGVLAYLHWPRVRQLVEGRFGWWFGGYLTYFLVFSTWLDLYSPSYFVKNPLNLVAHAMLAGVTLSAAFTAVELSNRLLHHFDISYGVYVYHFLVINTLYHHGHTGSPWLVFVTAAGAVLLGAASWVLVERPALRLKSAFARRAGPSVPGAAARDARATTSTGRPSRFPTR